MLVVPRNKRRNQSDSAETYTGGAIIIILHTTCSKEAQRCYCGAANCRGTIGGTKATPLKAQQDTQEETPEKKEKEKKKKRKDIFNDAYVSRISCVRDLS